jgi:hypothetical protein
MEAIARLRCLKLELPIAELYAGVELQREPETPAESL